jgi:hypothetical protein
METENVQAIKPGFKTSEFVAQLGPYAVVFALLYGVLDQETIDLIKRACAALPDWGQALVGLGVKVVSVVGGIVVGSKAVGVTQAYTLGRIELKGKDITRQAEAARFQVAVRAKYGNFDPPRK